MGKQAITVLYDSGSRESGGAGRSSNLVVRALSQVADLRTTRVAAAGQRDPVRLSPSGKPPERVTAGSRL